MDFFNSQDVAKRNTTRLMILFVLAVFSMVVLANLAVIIGLGFFNFEAGQQIQIDWSLFFIVSFGVVSIIGLGSFYKINSLSGGGDRIALQMNGEIVFSDDSDFKRKRLHNIVEEMAIASGVPVPSVYIIKSSGINAFAAGHSYSDAVIGVSSGALEQLIRDELQGVIAHEFSHILNGDMRINTRLIGILHGILLLGLIGKYLLHLTPRSQNSKRNAGSFAVLGVGLVVVGYSGTFFGNLIKAAVNRQREYLADSAAVQFTRNPDGIGGALIRIGITKNGSFLKRTDIEEISHALFSPGLASLFATHPPLKKRIKRILPTWDGTFIPLAATPASQTDTKSKQTTKERLSKKDIGQAATGAAVIHGKDIIDQVGHLDQEHIVHARQFIDTLPEKIMESVHSPYGARVLLYSLLLDRDQEERRKQLLYLKVTLDQVTYSKVTELTTVVTALKPEQRLPVVDLALPSLRQLSAHQYQKFKEIMIALIATDLKVSFFEWILYKVVIHHLDWTFNSNARTDPKEPSIRRAGEASAILLSVFLNNMQLKQDDLSREEVVAQVLKQTGWLDADILQLHHAQKVSLKELDAALNDLAGLKPRFKKMLLEACATVVIVDNQVQTRERELLRAVASSLNCPIPMTVNQQPCCPI